MASHKSFPVGDTICLTATIRVDDVLTNGTVEFEIQTPDGELASLDAVTTNGTGLFNQQYTIEQAGWHHWRCTSTGDALGVREGSFYASSSPITAEAIPGGGG